MARALKYTFSDYARNAVSREALLEPTKLQREMEKNGKSKRKKERREIKGQGRKEKDESIPGYVTLHNVQSLDDRKCFQQKKGKKGEAKGWCPQKIEHEADQLERSDITIEHGLPTCIENNCYLSDGTQSSKKSKPLIVRIKLRKHSEPDASLACSPSGRVDLLPPERTEVVFAPSQPSAETNVELGWVSSKPDQDLPCSTSEGVETIGQKRSASAAFEDQIQSEDSLHATLIENWIPPLIQFADVGDVVQGASCGHKHSGCWRLAYMHYPSRFHSSLLSISNACLENGNCCSTDGQRTRGSSGTVTLFVEILNKYLYFFGKGNPQITGAAMQGLVELIQTEI
ncbi:uncharacterized protein Pyn_14711 [Prunus yedoensis var. nudiflora]|uniref:Uncharacterized protein n=1 Tax=Prunus yedoensis var. nudiflora TaxID=2094558 RepID=A0A314ZCS8_PRUYE|nr:uncharacterized protein Pyn_14711 [Prunus yedoensis var. nudiflora]